MARIAESVRTGPDPWALVWGQPYIDGATLAAALTDDLLRNPDLDFRARLLVRVLRSGYSESQEAVMKYMSYDLLVRTQSDDEDVADAALAEWERACEAYNARVAAIRPKLPRSVPSLLDDFALHDATVTIGQSEDAENSIRMFLRLDEPRDQELCLDYRLAGPVQWTSHIQDPAPRAEMAWLYDELDVLEVALPAGGQVAVFTHAILFEGGVELQLRFFSLEWKRYKMVVYPAHPFLSSSGRTAAKLR